MKILGLDVGGTNVYPCATKILPYEVESHERKYVVGGGVKIRDAKNASDLFRLVDDSVFEFSGIHMKDFDLICIAAAGTWDESTGRVLHADEYYEGVLDIGTALSSVSVDMKKVVVVNDFEAQARAAQGLPGKNAKVILPGSGREGTKIVFGPGTGCGTAYLIWTGKEHILLRSEGGHSPLVVAFDWQGPILSWFAEDLPRPVIVEDVLSGGGFSTLAKCMTILWEDASDMFTLGFGFCPEKNEKLLSLVDPTPEELDKLVKAGEAPALQKAFAIFLGLELRSLVMNFWNASQIVLTGGVLGKCPELILDENGNASKDFEFALRSPYLLRSEGCHYNGWRETPPPQDKNIREVEVVLMQGSGNGAIGACDCGILAAHK